MSSVSDVADEGFSFGLHATKEKSEEDEEELAVVSDKLDIHNDFLFVMVFVSPQSNMGFH